MTKNDRFQVSFRPLAQWICARAAPKFIAFVLLGFIAAQASAATRRAQSGVVTYVGDGDTVWVQIGAHDKPLRVRLQGIDAPEICQAGGVQARDALKSRVMGQSVTVTSSAHDDYGRTVGTLHWQGQDMGRWLVANGHAWVYSYRHKKAPYAGEFAQAQAARRGVFSDAAAEEPRVFRKRLGSCYANKKR
jgi:micrococcal nuclease